MKYANIIGRSPSALNMKVGNFGRLDPELKKQGIKGLVHGSKLEEEVWDEFNDDWDKLAFESEKLIAKFQNKAIQDIFKKESATENLPKGLDKETDVALGMMPSKVWTGKYDATGGYLVIKDNGDVLCYHIYNRNEFENYLLNNTKLDTASSTRHDFGKIYESNGKLYFKLNLQIRFIK